MNRIEEELLLALLPPIGPNRVRQLLSQSDTIDWDALIRLAERHCVKPLVQAALNDLGIDRPGMIDASLKHFCQRNAMKNLAAMASLIKVMREFQDRQIKIYPYKGPYLATLAYGNLGLRVFGDLDILVSEHQVQVAVEALRSMGYEPCFPWVSAKVFLPLHYEYRLQHPSSGRIVELKWRVCPVRLGKWGKLGKSWASSTPDVLQGCLCHGPTLEELFVILVVHGTKHNWSRLQWLCDLAGLLGRGLDGDKILAHATEQQARRALWLALNLLRESLGLAVPSGLQSFFEQHPKQPVLSRAVQEQWFRPNGMSQPESRSFLLRIVDSRPQALAYLLRTIFSPTPSEILAVPFELPWTGLYYLVRPLRYLAKCIGLKVLQDPRETYAS